MIVGDSGSSLYKLSVVAQLDESTAAYDLSNEVDALLLIQNSLWRIFRYVLSRK